MRMAVRNRPATENPCAGGPIPPLGSVDSRRRVFAPRCPASVVAIIWHCHFAIGATAPSDSDAGVLQMFHHIASLVAFARAATGYAQLWCAKTESCADVPQKILVMQPTQHRFREHNNVLARSMPGFRFPQRCRSLRPVRYTRTKAAVRSASIAVGHPIRRNRSQVQRRQRDQPIQAFSSRRSTFCAPQARNRQAAVSALTYRQPKESLACKC
jgi:hypothetical protein